jgi:hypothetical protein
MSFDYYLNKFKYKMNNEVMPSIPVEVRPILMTMLMKAYTEGYQQCEKDFNIDGGF